MKKSKRLLALLLSVMLIVGVVFSVPFTVSAKTIELEETGASLLEFSEEILLGDKVRIDKDYYSAVDLKMRLGNPVYTRFDAEEVGQYVLYIKNNGMTAGKAKLNVAFTDQKDTEIASMTVENGEEQELSVRIEKTGLYYIRLIYDASNSSASGNMDLKLNYFADAEPDKIDPAIKIKASEAYEGSIDFADDKDWIFVQTANNKKHSITLENKNEDATAFKAEVYDTKDNLLGTVTTETENSVTLELTKPSEIVSYYICVTGADSDVRGKYSVKMDEVAPVYVNVPLDEDYYDTIAGYQKDGSTDYLKFTTIDKDAYYTIYVKNIDITTHSWGHDNAVQVEIRNEHEEFNRIRLLPASEGSVTVKLQPDTTYYLRIYNNYLPDTNGGNYKVHISYVLDPDKNEMKNATEKTLGEKYYGDLAARGDSDWFKFTTTEETDYTFTLKNINISTHSWSQDLRFRGVIYNDKNEVLATLRMFSGEELHTDVTLAPETTYYVEIFDPQGTTGNYSFDIKVKEVAETQTTEPTETQPDETKPQETKPQETKPEETKPQVTEPKETKPQENGNDSIPEVPLNEEYYDSIEGYGKEGSRDKLKFTTIDKVAYYTVTVKNINISTHTWASQNEVQADVVNDHDEKLANIYLTEGQEKGTTLMLEPNTTYYINVYNNYLPDANGGNYKVQISYVLDPEPNVMESGKLLRIGERYYGNIAASGDKDYFTITTTDKTDYILYLKNINIPTHSWANDHQFRVVLFNKYSENLGEIIATNGNEGNINVTLEPNTTYYLGIWDPDNTTGDYNVILSDGMLLGDVTLDDKVNIKDATAIQKNLAKLVELDAKQMTAADVTADDKVNIKDATAIQKFLAKIETEYKTGQLILNEIKYDEPATEATEPSDVVLTEPVVTTIAQAVTTTATEPSEVVTTTATEVTEPSEVVTTVVTEPVETTGEPEDTTPVESSMPESEPESEATEPTEEVYLTPLDELKALNKKASKLLEDYKEYEDEHPLKSNSVEIKLKKAMGYEDDGNEWITEHEKFFRTNDRVTYFLMHGYQYVDDYTEYITELKSAIEWFEYYVTEVHPEPVLGDRIIYFENTFGWESPNIYFWNSEAGDGDKNWPGEKMIERRDGLYYYEIPRDCNMVVFNSTENYKYYSVEIDLTKHEDAEGFRLIDEFNNGYSYEEIREVNPRPAL